MSRFLLFFICLLPALAGMWAGTEKFAALIHFDPVFLGEPIVGTLYAPWSIFNGMPDIVSMSHGFFYAYGLYISWLCPFFHFLLSLQA